VVDYLQLCPFSKYYALTHIPHILELSFCSALLSLFLLSLPLALSPSPSHTHLNMNMNTNTNMNMNMNINININMNTCYYITRTTQCIDLFGIHTLATIRGDLLLFGEPHAECYAFICYLVSVGLILAAALMRGISFENLVCVCLIHHG
jgi:hypothetical protein